MNKAKKVIYIVLGVICLGLGAIGVVLPILPTTPFLLVTAFCFARGSERINEWFLSTRLYKKHLASFVKSRSMKLQTKVFILAFASALLLIAFFAMNNIYGRIFIIILIIIKYYYFVFKIKTIK